jgi:hypothetical protein
VNTNLTFGGHSSSQWHFCTGVSWFLDRDFARADVDEDALHDDEEENQKNEGSKEQGNTDAISIISMVCPFQIQLEAVM